MTIKKNGEKIRKAHQTDQAILNYLKLQKKPVTFYHLYKDLEFSSGKAQTALKRLQESNKIFLKKRIKRFENLVWYKDFDIETEIIDLEAENEIIFPIYFDRTIGKILEEIPDLSNNYNNLTDLFKKAIIYYFKKGLTHNLKSEAIKQAVEKGKISKALGNQLLGV